MGIRLINDREEALQWPDLPSVQRSKPQSVLSFYFGHNCRNPGVVGQRLALIQQAKPLTTDSAIITNCSMTAKKLATQIRHLNKWENKTGEVTDSQPQMFRRS